MKMRDKQLRCDLSVDLKLGTVVQSKL